MARIDALLGGGYVSAAQAKSLRESKAAAYRAKDLFGKRRLTPAEFAHMVDRQLELILGILEQIVAEYGFGAQRLNAHSGTFAWVRASVDFGLLELAFNRRALDAASSRSEHVNSRRWQRRSAALGGFSSVVIPAKQTFPISFVMLWHIWFHAVFPHG